MSEKLIRYRANRRERVEDLNKNTAEIKDGSDIVEEHHIQSRKNSEIKIPICLACHNYITDKQNSLSVEQRKDSKLLALKSILAMLELTCEHFRFLIEKEIENDK